MRMVELQQELLALRISEWYEKVFSWQWAFLVLMLIVPWLLWWKIVDRKRITKIFALGLTVSIISSLLNANGLNLLLWSYPFRLLPFSPRAYSFSLSAIPVGIMLLYQYFPKIKSYLIATITFSAIVAFFVQPIFSIVGLYKLIKWNYLYSFLALIFISLTARLIHYAVVQKEYDDVADKTSQESMIHSEHPSPAYKKKPNNKDGV